MKFVILGCGSSVGVPWITGNWGNCKRKNKFNIRTRCSAYLKKGDLSILIDTSPTLRNNCSITILKMWIMFCIHTNTHSN